MLLDRRCDPAEAAPHLALGWLALARHRRPEAELGALADALDELPLEGLSAAQRREVRDAAPALAAALEAQLDGRSLPPPSARALKQQAFLLHRAVRGAAPAVDTRLPRRLRLVTGGLVFFAAVAAVLSLTLEPRTGWRGSYFANADLRPPARARVDARIAFDWRAAAPMADMPKNHFAVRWETCLSLPSSRPLLLMVGSNDGARVKLDGKTIIDNWKLQYFTWRSHRATVLVG